MNIKMKKLLSIALLTSQVYAVGGEDLELKETWGREMYQRCCTPSPTPPPPPVTPTNWSDLETTLITNPYYGLCVGNESIPVFVHRLKAIEGSGLSKSKILEHQLSFITSTWLTWKIWEANVGTDGNAVFCPTRYPLIYKFLVNRSQQTTTKSFWTSLGDWLVED